MGKMETASAAQNLSDLPYKKTLQLRWKESQEQIFKGEQYVKQSRKINFREYPSRVFNPEKDHSKNIKGE